MFGQNSFAVGGTTNTGISSGLDTSLSDYVALATYQPNSQLAFTSRFRFNQADFTLVRSEFEAAAGFGRWSASVKYGNYAAQPALGLLTRREGITVSGRVKMSPNWITYAGIQYDLLANQVSATSIGAGYVDDCLILALNYVTSYNYGGGSTRYNNTVVFQISLRTFGGTTTSQTPGDSALGVGAIR